jgi:cytosine/adenosine deaminase-related metal-dependent hydrolase
MLKKASMSRSEPTAPPATTGSMYSPRCARRHSSQGGGAGCAGPARAHAALHAATLGGARALGLGARIGSIEPGKRADLAALALRGPELAPCYDAVSQLVYAAGREHVTHVWVDGKLLVRDGALEHPASGLDTRWQIWQNAFEGPPGS